MSNYPESLKSIRCWVLWKTEDRDGHLTKVPYSSQYSGRASSTNPNTWGSFEEVIRELNRRPDFYNGIGIVLSPDLGLIFIDLDDCIDSNGEYSDTATDILNRLQGQYIEVSQSGHGIHILTRGTIPKNIKNSSLGVELYSCKRFMAMTGNTIYNGEPTDHQDVIDYLFSRYGTSDKYIKHDIRPIETSRKNDTWVLNHAKEHGNFNLLYKGEWSQAGYSSQSESDLALCITLAFWCDRDTGQMDRLFRSSGLYREKWLRDDYRTQTLERATLLCEETISDYRREQDKKRGEELDKAMREQWD